ncbi:MAG: diphosphatase [Conexibacter sp.]|nr:diphosphatase [Conexibacter sp.]
MPEPIAFAGGALDRAAHRRTDRAWLAEARSHPQARAIVVGAEGAHREPLQLLESDADAHFLGIGADGAPVFSVEREGVQLSGLRDLAVSLPAEQLGTIAYASALANWARANRFCGRCGTPTQPADAGHVLVCENGHQHHPRTDPVVIMLVTDGDRVLMGRQGSWPQGRYSALAGFVEPGERLEDAVEREVLEESGVTVRDVRYVASQPWPFPVSLMLGFRSSYAGGEPSAQAADGELEDVRWFDRAEVAAAVSGDESWIDGAPSDRLMLPPPTAIARLLVDRWLAER